MINQVIKYIKDNKMLTDNDKVVIGVSGGADSVCLFFVLLELKPIFHLELHVVHVNHEIRGKEALDDAKYVEQMCREYGAKYTLISKDVRAIAKREGISEEEAGRNIRYQAFEDICEKHSGNKIAIAHNRNDNAETVLFNLIRGSGLKGLTGITAVRGNIIRPLLCVTRQQIEDYLKIRNIPYCTDVTNFQTDYSRNKIRLKILPYMAENINNNVLDHIVQSSVMIDESLTYIEKNAKECFDRIVMEKDGQYSFHIDDFGRQDIVIQKHIIRRIVEILAGKLKNITSDHVDMILSLVKNHVGKRVDLPYGIIAKRGYQDINIYKEQVVIHDESGKKELGFEYYDITVPGVCFLQEVNQYVELNLLKIKKNLIIPQNGCTKWFDYDKIKNTVSLRTRKEGDYLQIDQMGSKKKLKAFYIDQKIPREERDKLPLLADGNHIMWIIGHRISEAYKIDENTKNILMVKLYGGNGNGTQN